MRPRARHLLICLAVAAGLLVMSPAQAASDSGVYVEFRASEAADAPVTERWKLYGSSHALIIGIDNYTNGWPRLSNAIRDARQVADALEEQGFEVELLLDATSEELRPKLKRFFAIKGANPDARLFVWFAGHGHTRYGEGYLVPADAPPPENPEFLLTALHMGDVGSMVRIASSKHVLAVFDSCFAGTVFQSQRARPPAAITGAVKRPVRQFLTSGDADQKVSDDGTFRTLFLRALRGEETADANRDGYLTGTELSFYLENRVINLTRGSQTPRGGKLRDPRFDQGDFVFLLPRVEPEPAPTPAARAPAPSEPAQGTFELAFWTAIQGSSDPADYQAYLEAYPAGKFAPLARSRVRSLEAKAEQDAAARSAKPAGPSPAQLEMALWNSIQGSDNPDDYQAYLETYPEGTFARLARARAESLSAAQTAASQTAALPPAAAPTPELTGSYDGEWIAKIQIQSIIPNGVAFRTEISGSKLSGSFAVGSSHGTLSGQISSDGVLTGHWVVYKTNWRQRWIEFSIPFQDGAFRAKGQARSTGSTPVEFTMTLAPAPQAVGGD